MCKRSQQRWKIYTCTPCLQTESCPGGRTWCLGRPGCCAPAPVCGCWARLACVRPPQMECCRTFLESREPLLLQPKYEVREHSGRWDSPNFSFQAWNSMSSREALAHLTTVRRAAAAATSSSFILSDNRRRKQQTGQRWHTGSFSFEFLAFSALFMSFLSCTLFPCSHSTGSVHNISAVCVYTCLCGCAGDTGGAGKDILLYTASVMTCSMSSQVVVSSS